MTKDEALDLALEALEEYCEHGAILRPLKVKDAIKQARSAPVQDTDAHYKGVVEGVQKLFDDKRAQPAPVQEQFRDATKMIVAGEIKPNYNISFHNNGKEVGKLDFNGPKLVFTGDAEESAKVFIDWVAQSFAARLEDERNAEREALARMCDEIDKESQSQWPKRLATMIRARGNT